MDNFGIIIEARTGSTRLPNKVLLKLFNFEGHIMFQAIISKKRISIIECNPRIGGASVSSMVWGLDSVAQFIKSKFDIKYKKLKANKSESMIIYKKTKFI